MNINSLILLIYLQLLFPFLIFCQDIEYAREVIKTLCSPSFHGRGYVYFGDKIAANYIRQELNKFETKNFNNNYYQQFNISINTFPSSIFISIDNDTLSPGEDYLVSSSSNSCYGTYDLIWLDKEIILNEAKLKSFFFEDYSNNFIVVDTAGINDNELKKKIEAITSLNLFKAKGIIEIFDKKLTYFHSQEVKSFPLILIERDKLPPGSKSIEINIKNKHYKNYETQNIIGYIEGETDSFIVFTAHYDHLGRMGANTYFPGANDNASGTAMALNLAKHYSNLEKKPKYSIAYMFFSAEEAGILGSKYYTENPLFPLSKIKFLINLDLVGTGDDGIKIVNGSVLIKEFDQLVAINNEKNYLKEVSPRGEAKNSDHYFFYENGVRAFFIYTLGGISEYHNIYDKAETLPLTEYNDLFRLLTDFVLQM